MTLASTHPQARIQRMLPISSGQTTPLYVRLIT